MMGVPRKVMKGTLTLAIVKAELRPISRMGTRIGAKDMKVPGSLP